MPRLGQLVVLALSAQLVGANSALSHGGAGPLCQPVSYGNNPGTLTGFGSGTLGSTVTFVMQSPHVFNADATLALSFGQANIPNSPFGGAILIDTNQLLLLFPAQRFGSLQASLLQDLNVPNNPNLSGQSLFAQCLYTDPSGALGASITNGVEVFLCGLLPDLVSMDALPTNPVVFVGSNVQIRDHVVNQGALASTATTVGIYFSTDANVNTADTLVGRRTLAPLNVDAGDPVYQTYFLPPGFLPGNYFVGAIADDQDNVAELNENNNTFVAGTPIQVRGAPSNLNYPVNPASYTVGSAVPPNIPTFNGAVQFFTIAPALPVGLSFDVLTGTVSGVPASPSPPTNYNVQAVNLAGSTSVVLGIQVN
jgi:hypothetical protein